MRYVVKPWQISILPCPYNDAANSAGSDLGGLLNQDSPSAVNNPSPKSVFKTRNPLLLIKVSRSFTTSSIYSELNNKQTGVSPKRKGKISP